MKIEEKYLALAEYEALDEKAKPEEKRIVLSDDAYAICEFIDNLIKKAEHLRVSMR